MKIKINELVIKKRMRSVKPEKVEAIAGSIKEVGLITPICVNSDLELVAGLHRVEAAKLLGWQEIECNVIDFNSELRQLLAEIDENLQRSDLSVLERSDWLKERKRIYEELYPETKKGATNQYTKDLLNADSALSTFTETTAKVTGQSKRTIETEIQIANNINEDVKEILKDTEFANQKTSLLDLSKLDAPQQLAVAKKAVEKSLPSLKDAITEVKKEEKGISLAAKKAEYIESAKAEIEVKPEIKHTDCISFLNEFEDNSIDLILTDPPYSTDIDNISEFTKEWLTVAIEKTKPNGRLLICSGAYPIEVKAFLDVLLSQDKFIVDNPLVWTYRNTLGVTPKMKYNLNYQFIWHLYTNKSRELDTSITNEMFSVMDINAPDGRLGNRLHTWQKPDELALRLVRHTTKEGDLIIDPFCCTGTFLLAANRLKRVSKGCDIDIDNLKIAEQRGCTIIGK